MKQTSITLKVANKHNTVRYINDAVKKIKERPNSHGFSNEEVTRVMKIHEELEKKIERIEKSNSFFNLLQKMVKAFENMDSLYGSYVKELRHLTSKGWFIGPNVIDDFYIDELSELVRKENVDALETRILNIYKEDKSIDELLKGCIKLFPHRELIYKEIFKLFQNKLYTSVVTLCYNQADGMCNDIWGCGFFDKDKKKNYQLKIIDNVDHNDIGFSTHFTHQLNITDNEMILYSDHAALRDKRSNSFNRHLVIHGHSTNYGSSNNAIRAILLLDFINYFASLNSEIE